VTWNRKLDIDHTLNEYKKQTYKNFEIIVIDNNSTDGARELIKEKYPEVHLFEMPENTGYHAFNVGMQNAKGEILIVTDNDAYLEPNGINKMVDKFNSNTNLGIATCTQVYFPFVELAYPYYQKEIIDPTKPFDVHYFPTAGVGLRKNMLEKIGYFDEDYFFWGCEMDLSTRAIVAGYDVKYFPDIIGYHRYYSHKEKSGKRHWFYYYSCRNIIFYYWKHYPFHIAFGRSILRIPFDFLWSLLVTKNIVLPFKILKAIITGFNKNLKKRKVIPKQYVKRALGYQSEINTLYTFVKYKIKYRIKLRNHIKGISEN
jgi:GT2 family glycosyltransferase